MSDAFHQIAGVCLTGLIALALPVTLFFASQQTPILLALCLLAAAGSISAPASQWRDATRRTVGSAAALALAGALVYALSSALWSSTPEAVLDRTLKLAVLASLALAALTIGRLMRFSTAPRLAPAALAGLSLLLILIGAEVLFGAFRGIEAIAPTPTDQANVANRGALCLAALALPLFALSRPAAPVFAALGLLAAALAATPFTGSLAAALALAAGAIVALLTAADRRLGDLALAALLLLSAGGAILIGADKTVFAAVTNWSLEQDIRAIAHRAGVWRTAVQLIEQAPWFGWGLDSTRNLLPPGTPLGAVIDLSATSEVSASQSSYLRAAPALPLHPHSGWLQIALELGIVGAVGLGVALATTAHRLKGWAERGALTAFIVVGSVSVGLWQSWWLSLACLAIFLTATAKATGPVGKAGEDRSKEPSP